MARSNEAGQPRRRRTLTLRRVVAAIAVSLGAVVATSNTLGTAPASGGAPAPLFGVLLASPQWLARDRAAGIRLATIGLNWTEWEPRSGVVDPSYQAAMVRTVSRYRAHGYQIAVDIGLQSAPGWALDLPGGELVDQSGGRSRTADFEFSQSVRNAASLYIRSVVATLGHVEFYRVGLSENGEMLYPNASGNQWWAFEPQAQGRHAERLPPGVAPTPLPGWIPGSSFWRGAPVTQNGVNDWYGWYLGALINAESWEISTYRAAGFPGTLQLVMPGTGALPETFQHRLTDRLAPEHFDPFFTMNTGAVWWRVLDALPDLAGTIVDVSSVYDASGNPRGNICEAGDSAVNYLQAPSLIATWSDTRWLSYLAHDHGLAVMGENPGNSPPADLPGIMNLVRGCQLTGLQWAWDYQLRSGHYVRLKQLAQSLRANF